MAQKLIPSSNSLVRYGNVEILSKKSESQPPPKKTLAETIFASDNEKKVRLIPEEVEETLSYILPPIEWEENGVRFRQKVSSEPVTRTDVIKLGERLDLRLRERRARMLGICSVRSELFGQCFDELIRQVTLNCAEQGILLMKVRDEMRMTCKAYQTLYENSIAFGLRKILQAHKDKDDKDETIKELKNEITQLQEKIVNLERAAKQENRRNAEIRLAEKKLNDEEKQFLKKTNQQLKLQLEGIVNPKK